MPLILSAWVKSEERGWSNRGLGGIMRVCWMWGCGSMWRPWTRVSPTLPRPSYVLNVKCLTGRLSEEELQRAQAPLQSGGGGKCRVQRLPLSGWVFVSCLMPGSHCLSLLHKQVCCCTENQKMFHGFADWVYYGECTSATFILLTIWIYR